MTDDGPRDYLARLRTAVAVALPADAQPDINRLVAFAEAMLDLADGGTAPRLHAWRTAVRALAREHLTGDDR